MGSTGFLFDYLVFSSTGPLMLAWVKRDVDSPYGPVATLHWAVPSAAAEPAPEAEDIHKTRVEMVEMTTEEQVQLESAEDQLGAVLWNSNSAALQHLHTHVFPDHPRLRGRLASRSQAGASSPVTTEPPVLRDICAVELGAGVGCFGIALAMAGARSVITDLKELLPLMSFNVRLNARRVQRQSDNHGVCEALAWKWGPSAATNPKKQLRKHAQACAAVEKGGGGAGAEDAEVAVATAMVKTLAAPSEPWLACASCLLGDTAAPSSSPQVAKVDYVVMCDALYGNPQAWPQLLYTLTEILVANPDACEVVNFCEQRVEDVEGAFLAMLTAENARTMDLWRRGKEAAQASGAPLATATGVKRSRETAAPTSSSESISAFAMTKEQAHALLESPASLLAFATFEKQRPLLLREGSTPYVWQYKREQVTDSVSDLQMPIYVTRIRWVRAVPDEGSANATTKRQRAE